VPLGENIAWAIQSDELLDLLQAAKLPVQVESTPCMPGASTRSTQEAAAVTGAATPSASGSNSIPNRNFNITPESQFSTRLWLIIGAAAAFVVVVVILIIVLVRSRKPQQVRGSPYVMPSHSSSPVLPSQTRPAFTNGSPRLRGISGTHAGMEFPLSYDIITMGRDPRSSQIVFKESDNLVSKRHCTVRLDRQAGGVILEDCGSTNGTFLENGERLRSGESRTLSPNGRFYVGSRNNMFQVS
jgi:hypothetical protein